MASLDAHRSARDIGVLKPGRRFACQERAAGKVATALLASPATAEPQPCPTASRFGSRGQVGNLNHVTPAKTPGAAKLMTKGKTHHLGIETNKDTPA